MHFCKGFFLLFAACLWVIPAFAQDNTYNLDKKYRIQNKGTIYLNSDDAEVTINGTNRSDVHVAIYREVDIDGWTVKSSGEFKVKVENRFGDLYITEKNTEEHNVVLGNVQEEYRISIEAPKNIALRIKGDDDQYEISNIDKKITLEADDTEVNLKNVKGKEFDFTIDDGRIRMDKGQGILSLTMDDGKFRTQRSFFDHIEAKTDDGEINISSTLADEGRYQFDMDDGSLVLNIAGGGGRVNINHDELNVDMGDQFEEIHVQENQSEYRLPGGTAKVGITTDDGDIRLNVL